MKKYITDDKERINQWIWPRIGREAPFSPSNKYQAFGIEQDGELIAGVAFDGFSTNARCQMHCAGIGKYWLTREFLNICFDYVFNQAKCKVIINTVKAKNVDSINFTKHIGFVEECVIKEAAGDDDLIILSLHRENCRWIKGLYV